MLDDLVLVLGVGRLEGVDLVLGALVELVLLGRGFARVLTDFKKRKRSGLAGKEEKRRGANLLLVRFKLLVLFPLVGFNVFGGF